MAGDALADLPKSEHDELCCIYAALILHEEGMDVNVKKTQADRLQKLVSASGNQIEKYWPLLFANALKGQDISALVTDLSGKAPSVSTTETEAAETAVAVETKKEEPKEEKVTLEDALEGGIGFGDDDEW